jgi:two-component system OmpR family response regulator
LDDVLVARRKPRRFLNHETFECRLKRILIWDSPEKTKAKIFETLGKDFEIEVVREAPPSNHAELVILDLSFLGVKGLELCSDLKDSPWSAELSVVCLTDGKTETAVAGYTAGADDCFSCDTERSEFLARVHARLKPKRNRAPTKFFVGEGLFELDAIKQTVSVPHVQGAEIIELTPHEFRLFLYLVEYEAKIVARGELMMAAWHQKVNVLPRTIDKHISSLRDKVKKICSIESVRGNGYILNFKPGQHGNLKTPKFPVS